MTRNVIHNFGKNVSFQPKHLAAPKSERELLHLLKQHRGESVRVMASRHAWSDAIVTDGLLISVEHFNHVRINHDKQSVTVGAGCQIKHLLQQLKSSGLTLPSLGLIDEQTVAGATATSTHGSGKNSLSHYVRKVRVAHYDPKTDEPIITEIDAGTDLQAARCSLGLLGVIVELELETRATYLIREHTERHISLESMLEAEEQFPLQQFYLMPWSWHLFGQHRVETQQPRSKSAGLYRVYWNFGIDWGLHLIVCMLARILRVNAAIRGFFRFVLPLTIPRKWYVADDSHALLTMQHELFRHIEIELFVRRSQLKAALEHVRETIMVFGGQKLECQTSRLPNIGRDPSEAIPDHSHSSYCHHYPICVRRVLADDTLISMTSPAVQASPMENLMDNIETSSEAMKIKSDNLETKVDEDWFAISFISYERPDRRAGFFAFANYLASSMRTRFRARCHWGKYNPLDRRANEQLYPNLPAFRQVVKRFDPHSRFSNQWLRDVLLDNGP